MKKILGNKKTRPKRHAGRRNHSPKPAKLKNKPHEELFKVDRSFNEDDPVLDGIKIQLGF
jgi:hypothetical protein